MARGRLEGEYAAADNGGGDIEIEGKKAKQFSSCRTCAQARTGQTLANREYTGYNKHDGRSVVGAVVGGKAVAQKDSTRGNKEYALR